MRTVVLLMVGAIAGAALPHEAFRVVLGAAVVWMVGHLRATRKMARQAEQRVGHLEADLAALRSQRLAPPSMDATPPVAELAPSAPLLPDPPASPMPVPQAAGAEVPSPSSSIPGSEDQAASEPPPPPLPPSPSAVAEAWTAVRNYFLGVNTVMQVGVVILLVGVGFLGKWAADNALFPIELRLAGAAGLGVALLSVGWRLRHKRLGYAVGLQGGGIGVIYLVTFFALRTYHLMDATPAFAILVVLTAASVLLAVLQNAKSLAVLGATGGFLAPVLASTGGGSHVGLFSYYALLNAGIVTVAWFRAWRELNLVGFFFTFAIGGLWGASRYRPEMYASTQLFLVLFVLMFTAIPVLYAWRQAPRLRGLLDGTLVFGTPLLAFAYQARLVSHFEYGLAFSALGLAALYAGLGTVLFRIAPQWARALVEAFVALGVGFATMTLPLGLGARWTALGWALEGLGLVWVGLRQHRRLPRFSGMLLQLGAAVAVTAQAPQRPEDTPVLNGHFFAAFCVGVAGIGIAWLMHRHREHLGRTEKWLGHGFMLWGVAWWYGAGLVEIDRFVAQQHAVLASLVWFAATAALADILARGQQWPTMFLPSLGLLPVGLVHLLVVAERYAHPFEHGGAVAWAAGLAVGLWVLRPGLSALPGAWVGGFHAQWLWWITGLLSWEVYWQVDQGVHASTTWPMAAQVLVVMLAVGVCVWGRPAWPLAAQRTAHLLVGSVPLLAYGVGWIGLANLTHAGSAFPLPYIPLLNPLDLAQGFVFFTGVLWLRTLVVERRVDADTRNAMVALYVAVAFYGLNATLLRAIHHMAGVRYTSVALWDSVVVQTALSIFWTLISLGAMVFATRTARRTVWIVAAVLLAVVVVKLFTVDLSALSTVARIVSFLAVGLLMLLVGYVSPVPPKPVGTAPGVTPEKAAS